MHELHTIKSEDRCERKAARTKKGYENKLFLLSTRAFP